MHTVALKLYHICALNRRQSPLLTADEVVITDIESAGTNAVQFSMYIRSQEGVLNGNSLLMAVEVRNDSPTTATIISQGVQDCI